MKVISTSDPSFEEAFQIIQGRGKVFDSELWQRVAAIVEDVAKRGDAALFEYTAKFDNHIIDENNVEISRSELDAAASKVTKEDWAILEFVG